MKYTLLELTQNILSSLDCDEVNSITDTVEAQQVAKIVRSVYMDIMERANLPEHYGPVNLQASGTSTYPVIMYLPSTVQDILWIKYDCIADGETASNYKDIQYLSLEDFMLNMYEKDEDETEVLTMSFTSNGHTVEYFYTDNAAPKYWTSLNDRTILFDSYDSDVDSTLQAAKTVCFAKRVIPWTESDSFTPDLDDSQFPLLLNEAKSLAWTELRQAQHPKAEQAARRHWSRLQRTKYSATEPKYFDSLPNFGRK